MQIVALLLIGVMVGGVLCFFTTMHIMLVRVNMTTIEMIGKDKKKGLLMCSFDESYSIVETNTIEEHGKVTTESIRPEETDDDSWLIACCPFCSPSVSKHVWNVGKERNFTQVKVLIVKTWGSSFHELCFVFLFNYRSLERIVFYGCCPYSRRTVMEFTFLIKPCSLTNQVTCNRKRSSIAFHYFSLRSLLEPSLAALRETTSPTS